MNLLEATSLAEWLKSDLAPHCDRIEIAGSVRRRKSDVGDIEIVCIPKKAMSGLFMDIECISNGFVDAFDKFEIVKGQPSGRYMRVDLKQAAAVGKFYADVFMVNPRNWGSILAIRTGSAEWVRQHLAGRWARMGYKSEGGILNRDGQSYGFPEEKDIFKLLGMDWIEPCDRNL